VYSQACQVLVGIADLSMLPERVLHWPWVATGPVRWDVAASQPLGLSLTGVVAGCQPVTGRSRLTRPTSRPSSRATPIDLGPSDRSPCRQREFYPSW